MDESVATTNISTTVNLATRKRRFFAFLIDSLVIGLIGRLSGLAFDDFYAQLGNSGLLIGAIIVLLYFGICNSKITNGKTLGKKLLKIRVVNRNSKPLSISKSFLRASCFAIFMAFNGSSISNSSCIPLVIVVGTLLFSISILEIYFVIVNKKTLQSFHDLLIGSFVVSAKDKGKITYTNKKSFLYGGAAIPVILLIIFTVLNLFAKNTYVADMVKIIDVINSELPVYNTSMYRHSETTAALSGESSTTKYINVTTIKKNKNESNEALAVKIAKIIFDSKFTFNEGETLCITIVEGYNIGIASSYTSKNINGTLEEWEKAIPFAELMDKSSKGNSQKNPQYEFLWRSVARAQHIVSGVLHVDTNKINEIKRTTTARIEINFTIDSVYKGDISDKEIIIRKTICGKQETGVHCYDSSLFTYNNQRIIAPINESSADTAKYAFTGSNAKSILLETEDNKIQIINEIAKQKDIIDNKKYAPICSIAKHYSELKKIIEDMLVKATAKKAYSDLEKLGLPTIPAMICMMDDRRELAAPLIMLEYPPKSKRVIQHTPRQVVDVLAIFLRQFAGNDFGYIYNGASAKHRDNTINGWRIFLWHLAND